MIIVNRLVELRYLVNSGRRGDLPAADCDYDPCPICVVHDELIADGLAYRARGVVRVTDAGIAHLEAARRS